MRGWPYAPAFFLLLRKRPDLNRLHDLSNFCGYTIGLRRARQKTRTIAPKNQQISELSPFVNKVKILFRSHSRVIQISLGRLNDNLRDPFWNGARLSINDHRLRFV